MKCRGCISLPLGLPGTMSKKPPLKKIFRTTFWLSVLGIIAVIFDFGFPHSQFLGAALRYFYMFILCVGLFALFMRYRYGTKKSPLWVKIFDLLTLLFALFIFTYPLFKESLPLYSSKIFMDNWIRFAMVFVFIREFSDLRITYKRTVFNPAQLFVLSFLAIIILGSFLLMLPNAATRQLSFIDALFTSTSAVCVTGLSVLDVSKDLTFLGQFLLMMLIQIGGLGIMTFASYFVYFFKGGSSYENQLVLSDMTNSQRLGNVFDILKTIIYITFIIEAFSAFMIFMSVENQFFATFIDKVFFSVFHAVSAFCNAGFSTLSNGLYESIVRYNYFFQFMVFFTFFMGGLGFPIIRNIVNFVGYKIQQLLPLNSEIIPYRPWVLKITSKITLITTLCLLAFGTISIFILEYSHSLHEHTGAGKFMAALFTASTPRTAGFHVVDMTTLTLPTIMLTLLLMWIGASPGSTGGGIKTSTFAIAMLNIVGLAQGKTKIEAFRREISDVSVKRAFATIMLSLVAIGISVLLVALFEQSSELVKIAFECFSAFSTTGLSLGITPLLTDGSKLVLIATMFVGRVTLLSILIAVMRQIPMSHHYRYPVEEIVIN